MTTANTPVEVQNAAALALLATHCGVCRRALRDPVSVELGIGPECRKKYAFNDSKVTPEAYARAKVIVYSLAMAASADRTIPTDVLIASDELQGVGFDKLAAVLVRNNAKISVTVHGEGKILIKVPYDNEASSALYRLGGNPHRDARGKFSGYVFPENYNKAAWSILKRFFVGTLGVGPRGPFIVSALPHAS